MNAVITGVRAVEGQLGVNISWHSPEKGFGQLSLTQYLSEGEPVLVIDSELMSRETVKEILDALVDSARILGEPKE